MSAATLEPPVVSRAETGRLISPPVPAPALQTTAPAPGRGRWRRTLLLSLAAMAGVAGAAWGVQAWLHARDYEETDDAFVEAHVVSLSPKVSAHVVKMYFDDNTEVQAGQRLLELDPRDFEAALMQAQANLAAAQGRLAQAEAEGKVAQAGTLESRAEVDRAAATAENARNDLQRDRSLTEQRVIDRRELDNAVERDKAAAAALESARQKVIGAEARIPLAEAQASAARGEVSQGEAMVRQAELNLSYCTVFAPVAGRVTQKNVEEGNYVQPGQTLLALVPARVWIVANYKETQLTAMTVGQPVQVRVDAFPRRPLHGRVESIQSGTGARFSLLPAENATGNYVKVVQRVPVKIMLEESAEVLARLAPGMSVEPEVRIR